MAFFEDLGKKTKAFAAVAADKAKDAAELTKINVAGALANIALNACLIPVWGGVGAAIASIISQFFTNVIIGFIYKPIRRNNYLMLKGLSPKVIIGVVGSVLSKKKGRE